MQVKRPLLATWSCLLAVLGLTWWTYHPGLHGDFLFDDFANMPALGANGPITHWATFLRYITSGTADPTGRPLTLLTFLLDGHDWPTAAYPFKRTNVLLHLTNSTLLTAFLIQLGKHAFVVDSQRAKLRLILASITAAGLWAIHPLFVSTVLYVVQREAMLPMTFVLLGLILWLQGRDLLMQGRLKAGTTLVIIGLTGCTVLASLSKANGVLLPLYAVLIEYLLLRKNSLHRGTPLEGARTYRWIFTLLAWLPAVAVLTYLIYVGIVGTMHGVGRPWTLSQRLLTEPRVLFDYLKLLWLPRPFTPGLFNDQIIASSSPWSPPSTGLALVGLIGLLTLGWMLRRRHPVTSLAMLFYFAGQLLESTTVPLELYYEHRNYIPAIFMFWPLSLWLWETGKYKASSWSQPKVVLASVLILGLATMTHVRADLWGNGQQQALLWAKLNPTSARAQANAANYEMSTGLTEAAERRLVAALHDHPDDPQITLNILSAHCQMGGITDNDLRLAKRTLAHLHQGEQVIFQWLGNAIELSATRGCPGLTNQAISAMLDAAEQNPRLQGVTGRMQDIYHLRGQIALSLHQSAEALMWFEKGLALRPSPQMAFEQAALLGSSGYPAEGLTLLDSFEADQYVDTPASLGMPRIHAWILHRQHYWDKELAHLRTTLRDDLGHDAEPNRPEGV
jgi:protein O-mannosyl-transferase